MASDAHPAPDSPAVNDPRATAEEPAPATESAVPAPDSPAQAAGSSPTVDASPAPVFGRTRFDLGMAGVALPAGSVLRAGGVFDATVFSRSTCFFAEGLAMLSAPVCGRGIYDVARLCRLVTSRMVGRGGPVAYWRLRPSLLRNASTDRSCRAASALSHRSPWRLRRRQGDRRASRWPPCSGT